MSFRTSLFSFLFVASWFHPQVPFEGEADEMDNGLPLDAPVVLAIHGIGGTAHDPYCKRLVVGCAARAWRPVVYSYWRLDWMDPRDLEAVVKHVADR